MTIPILTHAIAERLEAVDLAVMRARLQAMQAKPGNPHGIDCRTFGQATALSAKAMPIRDFNRVFGMTPQDVHHLKEITAYYQREVPASPFGIDVIPTHAETAFLSALTAAGYVQTGFHTALYGVPQLPTSSLPEAVRVREATLADHTLLADVFLRSLELPFRGEAELPEHFPALLGDPRWKIYLGFVADQPAGFAMLYLQDDLAVFAQAGTLPACRERGVQTALLRTRMETAFAHDCSLVAAQAVFGSPSMRNLQRFGLRVAYTKAEWTYVPRPQ